MANCNQTFSQKVSPIRARTSRKSMMISRKSIAGNSQMSDSLNTSKIDDLEVFKETKGRCGGCCTKSGWRNFKKKLGESSCFLFHRDSKLRKFCL